jgi:hypothetical protein
METSKKPWQSKTILLNFVVAASALFYPPVGEWIAAHPVEVASLFSLGNIVLRLVTKNAISISE